jgi:hypothetical protein
VELGGVGLVGIVSFLVFRRIDFGGIHVRTLTDMYAMLVPERALPIQLSQSNLQHISSADGAPNLIEEALNKIKDDSLENAGGARDHNLVTVLILITIAFGSATGVSVVLQPSQQIIPTLTPVVLLVLSLAYTAYWHAARSKPDRDIEGGFEANAKKAELFARTCGTIMIGLVVATLLVTFSSNGISMRIATVLSVGALIALSEMVFLYVIGRGVH